MIECIIKEIETRVAYLNKKTISSIYFGGGTPSILNKKEVQSILNTIYANFKVAKDIEITLECNPDDLNSSKLVSLKKAGINRLSIGIQSFNDTDLKFMNRSHNAKEALDCIHLAKKVGFENITIDLIYGLPKQNNKKWGENLKQILTLGIQHFSAYALTIEPKTALKHLIDTKKIIPLEDEIIVEHFNTLVQFAADNNFIHYEISNLGKESFFSNHNTAYWKNQHYIGIGPSAHSFNGYSRTWNISSNKKYIEQVLKNSIYSKTEILTKKQQYNEYILTSLRTIWGVKLSYISTQFGVDAKKYFKHQIQSWIAQEKVKKKSNNYTLTKKGKLYSDAIASDLFIV
jgi:oxygen-independent coproporphyrinogen III oxidase